MHVGLNVDSYGTLKRGTDRGEASGMEILAKPDGSCDITTDGASKRCGYGNGRCDHRGRWEASTSNAPFRCVRYRQLLSAGVRGGRDSSSLDMVGVRGREEASAARTRPWRLFGSARGDALAPHRQ